MPASNRNTRAEVQKVTRATTAGGMQTETWATVCKRWIKLNPRNVESQPADDKIMHTIELDYEKNLTLSSEYRFKVGDRIINIGAIINPGFRNRSTEILGAEERA